MGKVTEKTSIPFYTAERRCGVCLTTAIYMCLNIIRESSKVSLTKAQSNMMTRVVWSWYCQSRVKLHVWVSLLLVPLVCVSPALPKEEKTRKERERDFTDGGIELEEWEKRQVMGKGFEEHGTESVSQQCREDDSYTFHRIPKRTRDRRHQMIYFKQILKLAKKKKSQ